MYFHAKWWLLCLLSLKCFTHSTSRIFPKLWNNGRIFLSFSLGIFSHVIYLDQLHASEDIQWIIMFNIERSFVTIHFDKVCHFFWHKMIINFCSVMALSKTHVFDITCTKYMYSVYRDLHTFVPMGAMDFHALDYKKKSAVQAKWPIRLAFISDFSSMKQLL